VYGRFTVLPDEALPLQRSQLFGGAVRGYRDY